MPRLFWALFLGLAPAAAGITIGLTPVWQGVPPGSLVTVDVVISGLGDHTAPSVGDYDLTIDFNPAILAVNGVTFGDPVLGNQLDFFGFGTLSSWGLLLTGVLELSEISLDAPGDLDSGQAPGFTLARLAFNVLEVGTSTLVPGIISLGDANGAALAAGTSNASITGVPEPAVALLVGSGFVALGLWRRSRTGPR
jgi:hypothetical protein